MNRKILSSSEPVTLVGAGKCKRSDFDLALKHGPTIVAADGGAARVLSFSKQPEAVIGDMDSLPDEVAQCVPGEKLHRIEEQDSTDFDKAVRSIEASLILGVGFLGGRVDHQLAALNVLAKRPDRLIVLIGGGEAIWHVPRRIAFDTMDGDVVSLMPMSPVNGTSIGLEWPIDGLEFTPGGRIGTSNRATGALRLQMNMPGMLAITPLARLPSLLSGLLDLPHEARWPAHA